MVPELHTFGLTKGEKSAIIASHHLEIIFLLMQFKMTFDTLQPHQFACSFLVFNELFQEIFMNIITYPGTPTSSISAFDFYHASEELCICFC